MRVPASLVRGGTSKCWLFETAALRDRMDLDLPSLDRLLVNAYGAGDPAHIDGVGGATPTTSKAAFVQSSDQPGIDVDYLFGQVGIGVAGVEWGSNCGNCATAIALWAVTRGLVAPAGDRTTVVLRNSNTGAVLEADVDTTGGRVHEFGAEAVPGTDAGGVGVGLAFLDPAGNTTGHALPTGNAVDELLVDEVPLRVSMIDAGAPVVLVDAGSLGLTGREPITPGLVERLRRVRRAAAQRIGLPSGDAIPKVGIAGSPPSGSTEVDVCVRMLSMNAPHPTIGLTSAVAVAVAGSLCKSVVAAHSTAGEASSLRIGIPDGVVAVRCADFRDRLPRRVAVQRAARILCDAEIRVPEPAAPSAPRL
ncbi:PrpF domain-containing protein [Bounagaea algeriensis]